MSAASPTPRAPSPPTPPATPEVVVDPVDRTHRIDDRNSGERAVPYHCPFCAEQDLRPYGTTHGAWHCRTCLRAFSVRFLGLAQPPQWAPTPAPTPGGSR
jgi:hypothetical protein